MLRSILLITLGMLLPAAALAEPAAPRARVMVVGTYHFANPNQDYVKTDVDDHLSAGRQAQIDAVLAGLAAFKPTRIVVEAEAADTVVNAQYAEYLAGKRVLTSNETEQIGFRLAKLCGVRTLDLCDHRSDMDMGAVIAAAQATGNTAFLSQFQSVMTEVQAMAARQKTQTVAASLREMNAPALLDDHRAIYLQMTRVKGKDAFTGADVVAEWYRRNFCIAANIAAAIASPADRVVVIFGGGHAALLRDVLGSYPDIELVEPNDYLPTK